MTETEELYGVDPTPAISIDGVAYQEVLYMSAEADLETVADQTYTVPSGYHFFPVEMGIIITEVDGAIITQPTVRFGWTGTPAGFVTAILATALSALYARERYITLLNYNGQTTLVGGITVAGSGGTYKGVFYWKGILVEDG